MNKIILMGRLAKEPEIRYSQSATPTAIATFPLAVDRRYKRDNEPDADFFNCTAFGKQAEFCEKYLRKGTKILVAGRVQNDNYTNKEGQKVYSTKIMIEEIEFTESKASSARSESTPEPTAAACGDGFMEVPKDLQEELPFC